jgi:protein disulfide-isomerase
MKALGIKPLSGSGDGGALAALQARAAAEGKDKIVVLLTGTDWCPYCKDLDRDVIRRPEWKSFISEEAVFASYEYGPASHPTSGVKGEMLKRFDIEGFPTMIVLNAKGEVLGKEAGYGEGGVRHYKEWIESL